MIADDGVLRPLIAAKTGFDADAVLTVLKDAEDTALFRAAFDSLGARSVAG